MTTAISKGRNGSAVAYGDLVLDRIIKRTCSFLPCHENALSEPRGAHLIATDEFTCTDK